MRFFGLTLAVSGPYILKYSHENRKSRFTSRPAEIEFKSRSTSENSANQIGSQIITQGIVLFFCVFALLLRGIVGGLLMKIDSNKHIEELKSQTECEIGFENCKSGCRNPCKAKPMGGQLVDCSNNGCPRAEKCNYRTPFGFGQFCSCPLRIFAAANGINTSPL